MDVAYLDDFAISSTDSNGANPRVVSVLEHCGPYLHFAWGQIERLSFVETWDEVLGELEQSKSGLMLSP